MTKRHIHQLIVTFAGIYFIQLALATSVMPILEPSLTTLQEEKITTLPDLANKAPIWHLNTDDYQHYLWLMKNTPNGKWYPQLDPAEVLGLNADSEDEMLKYAKIQAQMTHDKVSRELAFTQLYRKAYQSLYPNELPIQSKLNTNHRGFFLQPGDRVWLFTGVQTTLSNFVYQSLINVI